MSKTILIAAGTCAFVAGLIYYLPASEQPQNLAEPGTAPDATVYTVPAGTGFGSADEQVADRAFTRTVAADNAADTMLSGPMMAVDDKTTEILLEEAAADLGQWAPWLAADRDEVTAEIRTHENRRGTVREPPSPTAADLARLYELVPELASDEDPPSTPPTLAELVEDENAVPLPPGSAPRPGPYFEPE